MGSTLTHCTTEHVSSIFSYQTVHFDSVQMEIMLYNSDDY